MHVAAVARGQGIGRALLDDAVAWARRRADRAQDRAPGLAAQRAAPEPLPQSAASSQEGYLHQHYRRRNGELWDAVVMGLVL